MKVLRRRFEIRVTALGYHMNRKYKAFSSAGPKFREKEGI